MPAQRLWEPRELSRGNAGATGQPQPCPCRQKEELCPQLCRAQESPSLGSCTFFPFFVTRCTCKFRHRILRRSAWPGPRARRVGTPNPWEGKGREGKQRTEAETPTNCIAETFNPKRCIFSQETMTHDLIFPGHKISKWFIWSEKNPVLPFFILGSCSFHTGFTNFQLAQ